LAGGKSFNWHPIVPDFILVGQKLEELGFVYGKGHIIVINPDER
jgi:hypothetical protein